MKYFSIEYFIHHCWIMAGSHAPEKHVRTSWWFRTPKLRTADPGNLTFPLPCPWLSADSVQTVVFIMFVFQCRTLTSQFSSFGLCCFFTVESFLQFISSINQWTLLWKHIYTQTFLYIHVFDYVLLLVACTVQWNVWTAYCFLSNKSVTFFNKLLCLEKLKLIHHR